MARVLAVGAIVTVNHDDALPKNAPLNLHLRLYAKVDDGTLVIDPAAQTAGLGIDRARLPDARGFRETVKLALSYGDLPSTHRQAQWSRIVNGLGERGIDTDPETLMNLPLELLLDAEAKASLKT